MRFIVEKTTFDKFHPVWRNEDGFFIRDLNTQRLSFSFYTSYAVAQKICERKNKE